VLDTNLIGGREAADLVIVDYDETWPAQFEHHRRRIAAALGPPAAATIGHIGSTSVPGLAAKPIIDILVAVGDPDDDAEFGPAMAAAGYHLRVRGDGTPDVPDANQDPAHALLAGGVRRGGPAPAVSRLAADPLRRPGSLPADQAGARGPPWPDMNYYAEAKGPVIAGIMARATVATRLDPPNPA
jgi:GrpB-like predicted nucleotidyltransferase (UPF0157 family)